MKEEGEQREELTGGGLVDEAERVEAGDAGRVDQGAALGVVEPAGARQHAVLEPPADLLLDVALRVKARNELEGTGGSGGRRDEP